MKCFDSLTSLIHFKKVILFLVYTLSYSYPYTLHDTIKSASELGYPPFAVVTTKGKADGFSVDLLKASLGVMEKNVVFKVNTWHKIKRELIDGSIEVLPLVGRTPERESVYDFTFSYLTMHGTIIVRKNNSDIKNIADLHLKEVAVMTGDNAYEYIIRENITTKIITTPTFEQAIRELSNGYHDAVIVQKLVALQIINQNNFKNLKTVGLPLAGLKQIFCFAVREGNSELLAILNEGLSIVIANGTYDKLREKWLTPIEVQNNIKNAFFIILAMLFTIIISMTITFIWQKSLRKALSDRTTTLNNVNIELQEHKNNLEEIIAKRNNDILQEIEDHEQTANELNREKDFVQSIVDTAQVIILVLDRDGCIVTFNPYMEEISGYSLAEVKGKNWFDTFIPMDDNKKIKEIFKKTVSKIDLKGVVNKIKTKDKNDKDIEWFTKTLIDNSGKVIGILSIGQDISIRLKMEEELIQTERMGLIGQLAGGVAHDFNNVLGAIIGYSDMALDEISPDSPIKDYLKTILLASERARRLVQQILTFSRQSPQVKKPIYIKPVLNEVLKFLQASLPSTIKIISDFSEDTRTVKADSTKIHEIVMNLSTNAANAMQDSGELTIALKEKTIDTPFRGIIGIVNPGSYSIIMVKDNGIGISGDNFKHIFEPFFTTKSPDKGTGMGLSVVYGIVQSHGGDILVETGKGTGTVFSIFLPQTDNQPQPVQVESDVILGGTESILFVDDEKMLVDLAQNSLGTLGYSVTTFQSSFDALNNFMSNPSKYDLVITDQTMPELSGYDLAKKILDIRPNIPVILCTGFTHAIDKKTAMDAGIKAFCIKPLGNRKLALKVRQVLEGIPMFI